GAKPCRRAAQRKAHAGQAGVGFALGGAATGLCTLLLLYAMGFLGAGDVKVFAGFGAWLGAEATLHALLYGSLVGGLLTVCVVAQCRLSLQELQWGLGQGELRLALGRARRRGATVPYAAALALGVMAASTGR
ncbi:MAG: hypothetical protein EOO40_11510, partial [Deltaproteobacteria bacterium]